MKITEITTFLLSIFGLIALMQCIRWVLWVRDNYVEGFSCGGDRSGHAMCHQIATANCQIPTTTIGDCWLQTYQNCTSRCNGKSICNCQAIATDACRSNDDPAEACYSSVHQKCMAGMGFAPDPDR